MTLDWNRFVLRLRRQLLSRIVRLRDYPWSLVRKQFFVHYLGFIGGITLTGYSIRYFVLLKAGQSLDSKNSGDITSELQFVAKLDDHLARLFLAIAIAGAIWTFFQVFVAHQPMARLLRLSRRPLQARVPSVEAAALNSGSLEPTDSDDEEDDSEWFDIERALNRLSRGIQKREGQLSREREELVTILGAVNDGIVAMGKETEPLYFNSRFALLFGLQDAADLELRPLKDRFRNPRLLEVFTKVLESGKTQSFRIRIRTALHDTEREFAVAVSPLTTRRGKETSFETYGAVAIFHDISELRQTEQIRVDFVANASHELRTPLTSVKGYVDTLIEDFESQKKMPSQSGDVSGAEPSLKLLKIVRRNVDRLIELVNDLLDLSTLESGSEVKREVVQTQEVTDHAIALLKGKQGEKIRFETVIHENVLLGDINRIEQVLVNLLDNASKYSPPGSVVRVVWERGVGKHSNETILSVKDSGPGVAEEHLPRLFERFYRVDAGRAREVGGTGLGLAIVKHIVLAHGGSIAVKSDPGSGCEFICRFPRVHRGD